MQGKIIKGIAGFYYVDVPAKGVYECKAKGIFRKENIKPLIGDDVEIEETSEKDYEGNIIKIFPRRSELIRPAVANIDQALLIFAITSPKPNYNLIDRFLIMMQGQGLECVLCFNKKDMADEKMCEGIREIYAAGGIRVLFASALKKEGIDEIMEALHSKTTALAGPSGVGKSSIVNCLQDKTHMETGEISEKIERGKHTTRHSEIVAVSENTYIMDTPGFSALSLFDIAKEGLKGFYPEFMPYEGRCRFFTCTHIHEPGCEVKNALSQGLISRIRYDNYIMLYKELSDKETLKKSENRRHR